VAVGINGGSVHIQERTRVVTQRTPCIEEVSLAIVLHDFSRGILEGPDCAITVGVYEVHRRWIVELPLIEEFTVFVEHLHLAIPTIADVDAPRYGVGSDAVNDVKITGPSLPAARFALLAPCCNEFPVLIELYNAVSVISVGDEHGAVREPCQERRPI